MASANGNGNGKEHAATVQDLYLGLERDLRPLRQVLVTHPVYARVGDLSSLRLFMTSHVFAVWDFMSLLKTLQRRLTCVDVPWLPPTDRLAARLVNDIVLGEETDEVEPGRFMSHFDLYLAAMDEIGADRGPIDEFLFALQSGITPDAALEDLAIPIETKQFVRGTLQTTTAPTLDVASSFLLGREDLVPAMFRSIIFELERQGSPCQSFRVYLDRHVHLDEEQHGPLAQRLLCSLCGSDPANWQLAIRSARTALSARRSLWDGVLRAMDQEAASRPTAIATSLEA